MKLYYRYGTMGSSKTANALMTKFNYEEKGYKVLLLKPSIDNRDGKTIVKSRIGLESEAVTFSPEDSLLNWWTNVDIEPDCLIVDEAQFCTVEQIEELKYIAERFIPIFCYGLRTDFQSNLFQGSKRLFEISDSISEIKSICKCGNKAIINARINEFGEVVHIGNQIEIGGNDKYIGMCYRCWSESP